MLFLFYKGKNDPSNFRLTYLLQKSSKIIERVVRCRVINFFSDENMIYDYQSEFRANHVTNSVNLFKHMKVYKQENTD